MVGRQRAGVVQQCFILCVKKLLERHGCVTRRCGYAGFVFWVAFTVNDGGQQRAATLSIYG